MTVPARIAARVDVELGLLALGTGDATTSDETMIARFQSTGMNAGTVNAS